MTQKIQHLIEKCKLKDQRAQMRVYELYCQSMYVVARRYLKNDEDAKDAMQEGFIKAFTKLNSYMDSYSFGAWLKRIVING